MRIIITSETLYDTELGTPLVWEAWIKAEEMLNDSTSSRRLLDLDNARDLIEYEKLPYSSADTLSEEEPCEFMGGSWDAAKCLLCGRFESQHTV